jgi:DNA excision repair protein ERCC-2
MEDGSLSGISDSKSNEFDLENIIDNLFPYDSIYPNQEKGIENTLDTIRDNGFHLIEGACGTGKTLIALVSALGVIRDPNTNYQRALVVTSVKQQQTAFEEDIGKINEAIIERWGHKK